MKSLRRYGVLEPPAHRPSGEIFSTLRPPKRASPIGPESWLPLGPGRIARRSGRHAGVSSGHAAAGVELERGPVGQRWRRSDSCSDAPDPGKRSRGLNPRGTHALAAGTRRGDRHHLRGDLTQRAQHGLPLPPVPGIAGHRPRTLGTVTMTREALRTGGARAVHGLDGG